MQQPIKKNSDQKPKQRPIKKNSDQKPKQRPIKKNSGRKSKQRPIKKNSGQKPKQRPIKKNSGRKSKQPTDKNVDSEPAAPGLQKQLEIFFSQYSKFRYKPERSSVTEFNRLCEEYEWKKDDPEEKAARSKFNLIMKDEFDSLYGSDEKDINNWFKLCHILRIDPLEICRAAVLRKHVNLVDLVERHRQDIRLFKSEKELSDYTQETGKFFPKEDAVDGGVLRALRRHILEPQDNDS